MPILMSKILPTLIFKSQFLIKSSSSGFFINIHFFPVLKCSTTSNSYMYFFNHRRARLQRQGQSFLVNCGTIDMQLVREMQISVHMEDSLNTRQKCSSGMDRIQNLTPFQYHCVETSSCSYLCYRLCILGFRVYVSFLISVSCSR